MEAVKLMAMQGGAGEGSYLQSSGVQSRGFEIYGKPCLARAIELYKEYNGPILTTNRRGSGIDGSSRSSSSSSRLIRIADYGCSYGWNTLNCMRFVLDTMLGSSGDSFKKDRLESSSSAGDDDSSSVNLVRRSAPIATNGFDQVAMAGDEDRLQFQYLFVDLPSNDFNSLFRMLHDPNFARAFGDDDPRLFSAGVAGSFYERVLPPQSVDLTITIYAIHFLSQIPAELLDKNDPAWNGGRIWIPSDGKRPAVEEAYAKRFQKDLRGFLRCRAEEMSRNGVMFSLSLCRTSERAPGPCRKLWNGIFNRTWDELVSEGTIEASKRDAFNLNFYEFSEAEFREALQEVSELELVELRVLPGCDHLPLRQRENLVSDPSAFGKFCASFLQGVNQPVLDAHIGPDRTSVLFERLGCIASRSHRSLADAFSFDLFLAILRKK